MDKLLDKLVLFSLCLAVYCTMVSGLYSVVPVLIAVIATCIVSYFNDMRIKLPAFVAFVAVCIFVPQIMIFLPIVCYEFPTQWLKIAAVSGLVLIIQFFSGNATFAAFSALLVAVSFLMSRRTDSLRKSEIEFCKMQDKAHEDLLSVQNKYRELLERQDYQVSVATLSERNRIARDIHDSVGHILSRSILQVGAMTATTKDPNQKEMLILLKDSLTEGMNSIRKSLHNLYDESVDLYAEIKGLTDNFSYCKVYLEYDMKENPERKIKYAFIAIVKESLTNIEKHSEASYAKVVLREQPAFYVLSIADNGKGLLKNETADGIGLRSIETRVNEIGGLLNINGENGFKIYISVPKGESNNENSHC